MNKVTLRLCAFVALVIIGCISYYSHSRATHEKYVSSALSKCSAKVSIVLGNSGHDINSCMKAMNNINEAIAYVDGIVNDVHIHEDGSVHFSNEQSFDYIKLCSDTLHKEKSYLQAVIALDQVSGTAKGTRLPGNTSSGVNPLEQERRERAYDEYIAQHKQLRETLTEMNNVNSVVSRIIPSGLLVDIGSIEHAQREIDFYPTRENSSE